MSSAVVFISRFLLFILVLMSSSSHGAAKEHVQEVARGDAAMEPLATPPGLEKLVLHETRRRLGSFQTCALCICCGGPMGLCLLSPCCYAINCNIPNRPFGFCSFTPRSCNCFGCQL